MILIVDDKTENLFSLKTLLRLNLFEVDSAQSGEEALKKILKKDYELIILDVQMPGMDGYEVAEAITGYSKSKNIPIIFLSAVNIDKRFVTKGYASGGLDYVTKPFDPDLLILKVKTFVRLYQQAQELIRVKATLEQKVSERTKELVEINKALESSNSELQQYAYIASHDLQEPLRKILTFSRMIAEKHFSAPSAREPLMDRVIDAAERMRRLINDLLDFSKLAVPSVFKRTSLNEITNAVLSDLEILIAEKGAHITVEDLPTVEIIGEQLHQAFLNLISNALKFSEKNVRPVIRVYSETIKEKSIGSEPAPDGRYCRIFITDNGIGFEEKYVDKIFTLFQRLHGKAEYEGTGIGLAIVKKIIDKHQGLISARSAAGKGATFIIVLPLEQSPQQPLVAAV
ncbi:MAG TPA: response regulator [Flavisolibacter sp.]|jgi:signal transduction histidine kinase|nr:response regulator [Flavisolibacter sp.]